MAHKDLATMVQLQTKDITACLNNLTDELSAIRLLLDRMVSISSRARCSCDREDQTEADG